MGMMCVYVCGDAASKTVTMNEMTFISVFSFSGAWVNTHWSGEGGRERCVAFQLRLDYSVHTQSLFNSMQCDSLHTYFLDSCLFWVHGNECVVRRAYAIIYWLMSGITFKEGKEGTVRRRASWKAPWNVCSKVSVHTVILYLSVTLLSSTYVICHR